MHHKRKGPKSTRGGCLLCKPWKHQGSKRTDRMRHSDRRKAASGNSSLTAAPDPSPMLVFENVQR